jgi:hypothetical protein
MTTPPVASAPLRAATLPLTPGADAGSVPALGGSHLHLDMKKMIIWSALGAFAGFLVPVIPGGPAGGALLGAALSMIL